MGLFDSVDWLLERGGQVVLDVGALSPFGIAVCGAEAMYHGAHAVRDLGHGHYGEAMSQAGESFWCGINTIPVIHHMLHPVHVAEAIWDGAVTVNRWVGSPFGKIPYLATGVSGILPRMLGIKGGEQTAHGVGGPEPAAQVA
jgi:hypothetical protein